MVASVPYGLLVEGRDGGREPYLHPRVVVAIFIFFLVAAIVVWWEGAIMNKLFIIENLEDAQKEIEATLRELKENAEFDYPELDVASRHLYHHINTAWNGRDATEREVAKCSERAFNAWRRYPSDLEIV